VKKSLNRWFRWLKSSISHLKKSYSMRRMRQNWIIMIGRYTLCRKGLSKCSWKSMKILGEIIVILIIRMRVVIIMTFKPSADLRKGMYSVKLNSSRILTELWVFEVWISPPCYAYREVILWECWEDSLKITSNSNTLRIYSLCRRTLGE